MCFRFFFCFAFFSLKKPCTAVRLLRAPRSAKCRSALQVRSSATAACARTPNAATVCARIYLFFLRGNVFFSFFFKLVFMPPACSGVSGELRWKVALFAVGWLERLFAYACKCLKIRPFILLDVFLFSCVAYVPF